MELRIFLVLLLVSLGFLFAPTEALAVMQSLDGVSTQDQTFTDDSNVTMTPSGSAHVVGWQGQLPVSRGGTGASSFTAGSLLFSNGTSILEDNANLFWDNANNRLRLGVEAGTGIIQGSDATTANTTGGAIQLISGNGLGTGLGGALNFAAGGGGATGNGGELNIDSGASGATSGNGGNISVTAGSSQTNGDGGRVDIQAGGGGETSGNGGDIDLLPGIAEGTGTNGKVTFRDPSSFLTAIFDTSILASANKTFTFPNFSGTFGLLEVGQTWSGLNKFEASTNSTIYVGSSTKTSCIAMGDSDGSGITYVTANDGVLTASSTKPSFCQ